ncbi:retrovirus-related pol polyprotein from transposon TNT 1-94 [Tanacetum coccineum]
MKNIFQMSSMRELTFFLRLQVKQKADGIFISQDKYVAKIVKKFDFANVKTASTPIETQKPLVKDEEASDVDVHLYRSMIGSLMYLTASRPDIMFATIVATSTIEAEYVAAANYRGQVLWIQNQLLDYGFNFMNTKIYIDNESTICIVKNLVYHSKTKYIAIRHHFIRDAYEKKLIQVLKIHTDDNVADLLTKAFDKRLKAMQSFMKLLIFLREAPFIMLSLYITAKVAGKLVSISEASIRSDLLFDNADGIDSLPNQAIFDAIQLMGYEGDLTVLTFNKALFSPQWSLLRMRVLLQRDHLNHNLHPLLLTQVKLMLKTQRPFTNTLPTPHIPNSILEVSGGNQGGQSSSDRSLSGTECGMTLQSFYDLCISLCTHVTDQANEIKTLKAQIKKLKKQAKLGRKSAKAEPLVHKDPLFDELDGDEIDNMDTEDAQDVERLRDVVNEEKENVDAKVSTEDVLSTAQEKVSTDTPKVSTDGSKVSTDKEKVSTDTPKVSTDGSKVSTNKEKDSTERTDEGIDDQTEGRRATQTIQTTQTTTSTMFGDDEIIAQILLNMSQAKSVSREKEKGVEFKDVEKTERPRPTSTRSLLTLKPLSKIDPKDKGREKLEEGDFFWGEKRLAKEEATNDALIRNYDDIKARIEADRLLAERLQEQEREQFTVEEREKFLHDTIAAQRRFLAQQRSEAIRNKPPTKNQLRNQMMTYLKH